MSLLIHPSSLRPHPLLMIHRLIEISMRNRALVIALYLGLAGWGYWALLATPIDAIPDLSDNQVIVFTDWPGRSPQEVEDRKSTRLNSSHSQISYAVFCLKKKNQTILTP